MLFPFVTLAVLAHWQVESREVSFPECKAWGRSGADLRDQTRVSPLASYACEQFCPEKKKKKTFKGDFNPLWRCFRCSALVLLSDEPSSPYILVTNILKEPMSQTTAKKETHSHTPTVLQALQLDGSRVSHALLSPVGSRHRNSLPRSWFRDVVSSEKPYPPTASACSAQVSKFSPRSMKKIFFPRRMLCWGFYLRSEV